MSRDAAVAFLRQVRTDEGIRDALGATPSMEQYVDEGAQAGHEFTSEELAGALSAEAFYTKTIEDVELSKWMAQTSHQEQVVEKANELGFECGMQDLKAVLRGIATEEELNEMELETVAGGMFPAATKDGGMVSAFPDVCKVPAPPSPFVPIPYPTINTTTSGTTTKSAGTKTAP